MGRAALLLLVLVACVDRPERNSSTQSPAGDSGDRAFALVQSRGKVAMGVDQYTSFHQFESLPDGGRISLQRDPGDSAGVVQIRSHMQGIAAAFGRGDFALPGLVHAREVPGTAVMAAHRSQIRYVADTLAGGGQVHLRTSDPSAIAAIHQFLAFQRQDHRSPSHEAAH
jgi:hypothetical protein